jgi:DNA-binding Lrp family transcriptional regulator
LQKERVAMGRHPKDIDIDLMLNLLTDGMTIKDTADMMGVSVPTLNNRIEKLKREESGLLAYDKVHHLDLIAVKQKLIEGVTEEKIGEAPLASIANAYGVFAKMEQLIQGRPTEIHGLMGYLLHLEKEDVAAASAGSVVEGEVVEDGTTQSN